MLRLLPILILTLIAAPARAGDETRAAVHTEVAKAWEWVHGKATAETDTRVLIEKIGSTVTVDALVSLQRAAALAAGKPAPDPNDARRAGLAKDAASLAKAWDAARDTLRGYLAWKHLPRAWAHLQRARMFAARMPAPDRESLAAKVRAKPPADLAKQVQALSLQLGGAGDLAAGKADIAAARAALLGTSGDPKATPAEHLAAVKACCVAIRGYLKLAPKAAFPGASAGAPAKDDTGQLVDHLKVGQVFVFVQTMDQPTLRIETREVYTVTAITKAEIRYDVERTTRTELKNPPAGMPPMKPIVMIQRDQRHPLRAPKPTRAARGVNVPTPLKEESLTLHGVTFDCKVYENSGIRTWVDPRRWPIIIKMEGKIEKKLVTISGGPKSTGRPTTGGTAVPKKPGALDAGKVKVGQKYHFKSEFDAAAISVETDMIWIVTKVTPDLVEYDLKTTTRTVMKNPPAGMPPMKPIERLTKNQKVLLTGPGAPGAVNPKGKQVGSDTITVDGQAFSCTIHENGDMKMWISPTFPFSIIVEKNGKPLLRLVKIEQP